MPAKSKHMEQRKQRIATAKKNARLAGKLRRRRQLQALGGLLAVAAVLTLAYLWQDGFFKDEEPVEDVPTSEVTESVDPLATDPAATDAATDGATESPAAEETPTETETE